MIPGLQVTFVGCLFIIRTDLYKVPDAVPPIHAVSSHVATDKGPSKFRSSLATICNQSQLAERKHVARYWSISAVPVSAHSFPLVVITTKLAAAILVVAVVRRRGSAGPVLPLWLDVSFNSDTHKSYQTKLKNLWSTTDNGNSQINKSTVCPDKKRPKCFSL